MFTGIVERSVPVARVAESPAGLRLVLDVFFNDVTLGQSISVNGVCLTVVEQADGRTAFDVIGETLRKTNLSELRAGDRVHVERALRVGDRLDGHVVQGHVDGTVAVIAVKADPADWRITLQAPTDLGRYIVPKGSVTLDGVSLTVASLADAASGAARFDVALIPATLEITQLGRRQPGDRVNLECDAMTKTIVATMERMRAWKAGRSVENKGGDVGGGDVGS